MALKLDIKKVKGDLDLCIKTDTKTAKLTLKNNGDKDQDYEFSLLKLTFQKKMYQPTVINALVLINSLEIPNERGKREAWNPISKDTLITLFLNKQVELTSVEGESGKTIGKDYYVQEVLPSFKKSQLNLTLKIYSPDKLLTLEHNSRTFVSKKLGDGIMKSVMPKMPYSTSSIKYDITNMKVLAYNKKLDKLKDKANWSNQETPEYEEKEVTTEHIFPYLVQYNESIYDMLARTCNRWGEFMYYENEQLNVGYSTTGKEVITNEDASKNKFHTITYVNLDEIGLGKNYDRAADDDDNFVSNELSKSPNKVKGMFLAPWLPDWDKALMKKFSSFFKNEKNVPSFLGKELINDSYALAQKIIEVDHADSSFNESYFVDDLRDAAPEKFNGDHKSYSSCNLFTEIKSDNIDYSRDKYGDILFKEQNAAKDAVCIDFDTNYPGLKLGQVIEVYDKEYIVVQIDCKPLYEQKIINSMWVVDNVDNPDLVYQVIATSKNRVKAKETDKEPTDKLFYPTILPTGHVRYADPQMAVVSDVDDPDDNGRVRVKFTWQDKGDDDSPWLQFAANASGKKGIMGKHYVKDKVFVGFLDGNVERPYVLGALSKGASSDVHCATPGGHVLKLNDDPSGISKFLTGMFWPGWGTLSGFIPQMGELPETKGETGIKLGGGFELSDYYGLYKISGSSEDRQVNIASPWGDVNINAFTGITISAPNGDVSIKGKNISIEAGNNLELVSGTNVKNKIMGGSKSGFFEDVAIAVTKKLAEDALSLVTVDLSVVRAAFEVVFRPTEGKLLVKSNRYLMLESGKGECNYPAPAYRDKETVDKLVKEIEENSLRKGVQISHGIKALVTKINEVVNGIDTNYIEKYNNCVNKLTAFQDIIKKQDYVKWSEKYNPTNAPSPKICKNYADLKDKFWAEGDNQITKDDLDFSGNGYGETKDNVDKALQEYNRTYTRSRKTPDEKKEAIASKRQRIIKKIVKSAEELRTAIIELKALQTLSDSELMTLVNPIDYLTGSHRKAFVKAFSKENLKDSFYFQDFTDEQKKLESQYVANSFDDDRKYLKRKAAILMLEEIGFKDEWRQKIADPSWQPDPLLPSLVAPKVMAVERKVSKENLKIDDNWEKYVDTIVAVPPMAPDSPSNFVKAMKKIGENFVQNYKDAIHLWSLSENKSWGDNKKGAILFSSDDEMYQLGSNISDVPGLKDYLTSDDDSGTNTTIGDYLKAIRDNMKGLN